MTPQLQNISPLQAWILAARPKTLPAAISPVIVGAALAASDGQFVLPTVLAALLAALLLQIGSNFANDYFDAVNGADTPDRVGPLRVTAAGLISHAAMRKGMIVVFGLAALIGVYLALVGGWPILVIGGAAIIAALAYTGGPKPYGYYGMGDLFVFLFFGPVAVCGTYYLQTRQLTTTAFLASLAIGALITAILVVNNLRDLKSDEGAGKITLAVLLGIEGTRGEYLILLAIAYVIPLVLVIVGGHIWLLLPLITLPQAVVLYVTIRSVADGPTLNKSLAGTARLSLAFAVTLAAGLLLG